MSFVIVATIIPKPGEREGLISAIEKVIARVHAEDAGCELYSLNEGKDRLVFVEKWASSDAMKAHGASSALAELTAALDGRIEGELDVQVLRPHPAGDPVLGAV
jgi:quinol monooxygenase YgiN